jgi:hypothetical protein
VHEYVVHDIPTSLEPNRIFGDHDDLCTRVHAALRARGCTPEELRCATAPHYGTSEFAFEFDAITFRPLSLKYQVWLDFLKPINLRPDACGRDVFEANESLLSSYEFGREAPDASVPA